MDHSQVKKSIDLPNSIENTIKQEESRLEEEEEQPHDKEKSPSNYLNLPSLDIQPKMPKPTNQLHEFSNAWKSENNLSVLLIQKLSIIITNYYKMIPELKKRNEQIQILATYNKRLIQILQLFESREKKLLHKLKSIQEISSKCMAELCNLKGKPFKAPQIRQQNSIFENFSLTNLSYQLKQEKVIEEDLNYKKNIETFFINYLTSTKFEGPTIEKLTGIIEKQIQSGSVAEQELKSKENLLKKIQKYNQSIEQATFKDAFDFYELKKQIKKGLSLITGSEKSIQKQEKKDQKGLDELFKNIAHIHSRLMKLDQQTLQDFLKNEREIRKKIRKHRTHEQQTFIKVCQKTETENNLLKQDIQYYKKTIQEHKEIISRLKAELDYKQMKMKANNKSSMLDQSVNVDPDSRMSRRLLRQNIKILEKENNELKEQKKQRLKLIDDAKQSRANILERLHDQQIILKANIEDQIGFSSALSQKLVQMRKQVMEAHKQDSLVSPNLEGICAFGSNNQFLKVIPELENDEYQKMQDKYNAEIAALKNKIKELEQKIKSLQKQINDKEVFIKEHVESSEKEINQKITKINELVSEYSMLNKKIKELSLENKILIRREYLSQVLGNNLVQIAQTFQNQPINELNYKQIIQKLSDDLNEKTKGYEEQRLRERIEEKILLDSNDLTSSRNPDPSEQSIHLSFFSHQSKRKDKNKSKTKTQKNHPFKKKQSLKDSPQTTPIKALTLVRRDSEDEEKLSPNNILRPVCHQSEKKKVTRTYQQQAMQKPEEESLLKAGTHLDRKGNELKVEYNRSERSDRSDVFDEKSIISNMISQIVKQIDDPNQNTDKKKNNFETPKDPSYSQQKQAALASQLNLISEKVPHQNGQNSEQQSYADKYRLERSKQIQQEFLNVLDQGPQLHISNIEPQTRNNQLLGMPQLSRQKDIKDSHSFVANLLSSFDIGNKASQQKNQSNDKSSEIGYNIVISKPKEQKSQSIKLKSEKSQMSHEKSIVPSERSMFPGKQSRIDDFFKRNSENEEVSLNFSEEKQEFSDQIKIANFGLETEMNERMIYRLNNKLKDPDTLDFHELYVRFKQAINCLDRAERLNKHHQRKYQNFIKKLQEKVIIDSKQYSFPEQIFHLTRLVNEQREKLMEWQKQFNMEFSREITESQKTINEHIKMMRSQRRTHVNRNTAN